MTFTTDQLNELIAGAFKFIEKKAPVLFGMEHPLLKKLVEKKQRADGTKLTFPVNFNPMQNIEYITGTSADVYNMNTQQNLTYAELSWKMYNAGFSITLQDLAMASGDNAVIDIVAAKTENLVEGLKNFLHAGLYGSAAVNTNALNGFGDIFAASGTAYGGLTDTDFGTDTAGDNLWLPLIDTSTHYASYANISPYITRIKAKDATALDYILTTPAIFQAYKASQQASGQRYVGEKDLKSGFDGLLIDGVPMLPDAFVSGTGGGTDDSYLYGITSSTMMLKYRFGWDNPSPTSNKEGVKIPNQPVIYRNEEYVLNLACNDRRKNFVMKQLDPTQSAT